LSNFSLEAAWRAKVAYSILGATLYINMVALGRLPAAGWFTEGFDTPVLPEAKALLDELA